MNRKGILLTALVLGTCVCAIAKAGMLTYQGKIYTDEGVPYNGAVQMTVRIYSVDAGGAPLWEETDTVEIVNGVFSTVLGDKASLEGVDFSRALYLGVEVNNDGEMSPRMLITSVPSSMYAGKAGYAEAVTIVNYSYVLCWYSIEPCGALPNTSLSSYRLLTDDDPSLYLPIKNDTTRVQLYLVNIFMGLYNPGTINKVVRYSPALDSEPVYPVHICSIHPSTFTANEEFDTGSCFSSYIFEVPPGTHTLTLRYATDQQSTDNLELVALRFQLVRIR